MTGIYAGNQRRGLSLHQTHRSEKGPYSHIWELVGCLPRRKTDVDRLVRRFLDEVSWSTLLVKCLQLTYPACSWNLSMTVYMKTLSNQVMTLSGTASGEMTI